MIDERCVHELAAVLARVLDDDQRADLDAALHVGTVEQTRTRRRNGRGYDPAGVDLIRAALRLPSERVRSLSGQDRSGMVTLDAALERTGVPRSTLSRWARKSDGVHSVKAGRDWLVDLDYVERKATERERNTG